MNKFGFKSYSDLVIVGLSFWCLLTFFPLLFEVDKIFGGDSMVLHSQFLRPWYGVNLFLVDAKSMELSIGCVLLLLIVSIAQYFLENTSRLIFAIIQILLVENISMYFLSFQSSGWVVIRLLFFYYIISNLFFHLSKKNEQIDYFLVPLVKTQLYLIYFMAASIKLTGVSWLSGYAAKYAMLNPHYSLISNYVHLIPDIFLVIGSYSVLTYQLTFPVTLIFKRTTKIYFAFGIMFHFMVLVTFGLKTFFIGMVICLFSLKYPSQASTFRKQCEKES